MLMNRLLVQGEVMECFPYIDENKREHGNDGSNKWK